MSPVRLASRNPFESVVLVACLATSTPGALGLTPPSTAVVAQIGPAARWWLIALALSAAVALVGLIIQSPRRVALSVNALLFEQVGVFAFGWSCVFYAVAAGMYGGLGALTASGLILGFGLAGFWQAVKIENVLRRLRGKPELRLIPVRLEALNKRALRRVIIGRRR